MPTLDELRKMSSAWEAGYKDAERLKAKEPKPFYNPYKGSPTFADHWNNGFAAYLKDKKKCT
jgi:hypothetical protein